MDDLQLHNAREAYEKDIENIVASHYGDVNEHADLIRELTLACYNRFGPLRVRLWGNTPYKRKKLAEVKSKTS